MLRMVWGLHRGKNTQGIVVSDYKWSTSKPNWRMAMTIALYMQCPSSSACWTSCIYTFCQLVVDLVIWCDGASQIDELMDCLQLHHANVGKSNSLLAGERPSFSWPLAKIAWQPLWGQQRQHCLQSWRSLDQLLQGLHVDLLIRE